MNSNLPTTHKADVTTYVFQMRVLRLREVDPLDRAFGPVSGCIHARRANRSWKKEGAAHCLLPAFPIRQWQLLLWGTVTHFSDRNSKREEAASYLWRRLVYTFSWKCSLLGCVWLLVTPWTVACQALLSMGFSGQEYWSGLPFPSPEYLPDPGIKARSPALQADSLLFEPRGKPHTFSYGNIKLQKCFFVTGD